MTDETLKNSGQAGRYEECSTNLELDLLPSFLELIVPLIEVGFAAREAKQVVELAKTMSVDGEHDNAQHAGESTGRVAQKS